jgi:membrane protein DedA with SNARE-associated domain
VTALAFLIGWRYRLSGQGLLLGSVATVAIIVVDTLVFWQGRIILPIVLALLAWFLGEFAGHYLGRWLGHAPLSDRGGS